MRHNELWFTLDLCFKELLLHASFTRISSKSYIGIDPRYDIILLIILRFTWLNFTICRLVDTGYHEPCRIFPSHELDQKSLGYLLIVTILFLPIACQLLNYQRRIVAAKCLDVKRVVSNISLTFLHHLRASDHSANTLMSPLSCALAVDSIPACYFLTSMSKCTVEKCYYQVLFLAHRSVVLSPGFHHFNALKPEPFKCKQSPYFLDWQ